jgi:hypothetical protein
MPRTSPGKVQCFFDPISSFTGQLRVQTSIPLALVSHCQLEIFPHRMPLEHGRFLELATHSGGGNLGLVQPQQIKILSQNNSTGVGFRFASNNIHHGGFTGAVRTDHTPGLALEHKYGTDRVDNPQDTSTSASLASHR